MAKILTVFYSYKGETMAPNNQIVNLEKGHTAAAAEFIQKAVGGDIFEIETVKTYKKDHMEMCNEVREEQEKGIRPELKGFIDIDEYDVIFIGYPNWWRTLPMPVVSFLEHYNWSGKRIIPFVTSGGGGFGRSLKVMNEICTGAEIAAGGDFLGHQVENSELEISDWAKYALG